MLTADPTILPVPSRRSELKQLVALAIPVAITQLGLMLTGVVDTMMVGHMGAKPLGALALGNTVMWAVLLPCLGLLMGIDPLVAQAHGRGDERGARLALERASLLSVVLCLPASAILMVTEPLLLLLGQDPELAQLAQQYNSWRLPSIPGVLFFSVQRQYLQGRGITAPAAWVMVVGNVINLIANWALIWGHLGAPALGLTGAAIATSGSSLLLPLMLWILARRLGVMRTNDAASTGGLMQKEAWSGRGLWQVIVLGAPVAVHMGLEHWAFAGSAVLSGWVDTNAVSGHHVTLNLAALAFMLPLGISMGAVTRVGNLIGAGDLIGMRRALWLAVGLSAATMSCSALLFVTTRYALAHLYTDDPQIIALVVGTLPIVAAFQLADGLQCVAAGILRGMGRPRPGAVVNLLCYYAIAFPIAYELAFNRQLGLRGIWIALAVGVWLAALLLLAWVVRTSRRSLAELSHHVHAN